MKDILKIIANPSKYRAAGTFGYYVTKDGNKVNYTYGACFAGLQQNTEKDNPYVKFCFFVPDIWSEQGSVMRWAAKQLRKTGLQFTFREARKGECDIQSIQYENGIRIPCNIYDGLPLYVVTMDLTKITAPELYVIGVFFRISWEYTENFKTFIRLMDKFPEFDLFTLFIAAQCLSSWPVGHSWVDSIPKVVNQRQIISNLRDADKGVRTLKYKPNGKSITSRFTTDGTRTAGLPFVEITKEYLLSYRSVEDFNNYMKGIKHASNCSW